MFQIYLNHILTFNINIINQETIEILKTAPSKRTDIQIRQLQYETSNIELFNSHKEEGEDNELHRLCCMYMKYEFFKKDQAVFNIGKILSVNFFKKVPIIQNFNNCQINQIYIFFTDDSGTKFYIILSGEVGVYIRMPKQKKQEIVLHSNDEANFNEQNPLQKVKELTIGDSFGELAILKNSKRLASIICKEDCHFAVIDKKIFNLALKEKEVEKLEVQMQFLANSPLFCKLPKNTIKILHMNAFHVFYKKNQPVYLEKQNPNACYIVKSGEFTIYKTIEHVQAHFEKKNQYFLGGEGQKTIELKISVLSRGQIFGEIELISGETRQTSAYCTSLDGGELMIINRTDLEQRVFHDEFYKSQFQNYAYIKDQQQIKRVEGIKNQLMQYKNYRFMTNALKNEQIDVCEQIKNKQFNCSLNVIDEVFKISNNYTLGEQNELFYVPKSLQNIPHQKQDKQLKTRKSFQNIIGQNNERRESNYNLLQGGEQNNQIQSQKGRRSINLNANDEKTQNLTSHITKNGKEQLINQLFSKDDNNDDEQKQEKKNMRVELVPYTDLKYNTQKMAAVALSKQFRQPYQNFMNYGHIYEISVSEKNLRNSQKSQQSRKLQNNQTNKEEKLIMSLSNIRRKSMTQLQNYKSQTKIQLPDNNIVSLQEINSQYNIDDQIIFKKAPSKILASNQSKQDIGHSEGGHQIDSISHQNLNHRNLIRSLSNMGSTTNSYKQIESLSEIEKLEKMNEIEKINQFKFNKNHQYQEMNSATSIKIENEKIEEEEQEYLKDSFEIMQENKINSSIEEITTKNQRKLKNILKINTSAGKDQPENFSTCSTNLNSTLKASKRSSLISPSSLSSKKLFKQPPIESDQTKSCTSFYPLKTAEISYQKHNKNQQNTHPQRIHNLDSSSKGPSFQSARRLSHVLQSKNFIDDEESHPYFISTYTFLNDQNDLQNKVKSSEKKTQIQNIFSFAQTPSNQNQNNTDFFSTHKLLISNMNTNKIQREVEKKKDNDYLLTSKDDRDRNIQQLNKKQSSSKQLENKCNSCFVYDLNLLLPMKNIDNKKEQQNKSQQYKRHIRKLSDSLPSNFQQENINTIQQQQQQQMVKFPVNPFNSIKRKSHDQIQPIYKFQLEQHKAIKKQK